MLYDEVIRFGVMLLIFTPLEILFPRRDIAIARAHRLTDLLYIFVASVITAAFTTIIMLGGAATLSPLAHEGVQNWVGGLSLWVSVPLMMLVADIGYYWVHRLHHEIPALWKLHAIHHSIEEMDWMAAHRVHPIDQALTRGISFVPVILLGFSSSTVVIWAFIFAYQSLLKHSNVRVGFGLMRWVFVDPVYHHWHHANQSEAFDRNYAGQLPVLDLVFGTAFMKTADTLMHYGTDTKVPDSFVGQILHPLSIKKLRKSKMPVAKTWQ